MFNAAIRIAISSIILVAVLSVQGASEAAPQLPLSSDQPSLTDSQAPALQTLANVGGQPDDLTVDPRGRLVWGDIARGIVYRLDGRRIITVVRGLSVPEGIIALSHGVLIVAEQGSDRILRVGPRGGITVLYALSPLPGQEGVDGIGLDPGARMLLVPDSPRGTLLEMSLSGGNVHVLARGLGRPVDAAVSRNGTVLVPDEHLGTLVKVSRQGSVTHRGSFSTPDDVAVDGQGRVWVTSLGDGGLWLLSPGAQPQRVLAGLANPQGLTLDRCGDPIVVEQNTARIVRVLLNSRSKRCAL